MMRSTVSAPQLSRPATMLIWVILALSSNAFAQIGPTSSQSQSQSTQPIQLPLSGRSGQSGTVTATQTPIPGTTTSVNTINPTVQVQGPYAGSSPSTIR